MVKISPMFPREETGAKFEPLYFAIMSVSRHAKKRDYSYNLAPSLLRFFAPSLLRLFVGLAKARFNVARSGHRKKQT